MAGNLPAIIALGDRSIPTLYHTWHDFAEASQIGPIAQPTQKPPRHSRGRLRRRRRRGIWRGSRSSEFDVVAVSDEARLLLKLKSEKFSLKTFLDVGQSLASSRNQFFVSLVCLFFGSSAQWGPSCLARAYHGVPYLYGNNVFQNSSRTGSLPSLVYGVSNIFGKLLIHKRENSHFPRVFFKFRWP